jgi:thymidylate kinase
MNPKIEYLKKVLMEFNQQGIQYVVLRNYEFLLGQDYPIESLDTVISRKDMYKAHCILSKFGFHKRLQQFSKAHKAYFKFINLEPISFDIQVGGVHWNDMAYLGEEIFLNKTKKEFFYTLSKDDYFIMLIAHSILGKRFFKPKYQQILLNLKINEEYVFSKLSTIFSKKEAFVMLKCIRDNEFGKINIQKNLTLFLLRKPSRIFTLTALSLRWLKQRKNPFKISPLISIIGPDGAGKSTMVDKVNNHLQKLGKKTALSYTGRGRNHILPITKIFRVYKKKEKRITTEKPSIKKKYNLKKTMIYTLASPIFTLDLYLRYLFRILPKRMQGNIVITDRYCSDIILMDNVPFAIRKFLLHLFPKPTMTFYLYNDANILKQRRPEESLEGLKRQMYYFAKLNNYLKPMQLITNDKKQNFEKVMENIAMNLYYHWN